jgi:hypothetical protein
MTAGRRNSQDAGGRRVGLAIAIGGVFLVALIVVLLLAS